MNFLSLLSTEQNTAFMTTHFGVVELACTKDYDHTVKVRVAGTEEATLPTKTAAVIISTTFGLVVT